VKLQTKLTHLRALALVVCFANAALPAKAASIGDCRDPKIIPSAEVNTVVLGYSYAGRENTALNGAAAQITPLILYDALLSQLEYRYRSIAVVQLVHPDGGSRDSIPSCTPEDITKKLVEQLLPGHKLLFLWGNLFEDGGSIFIQSFMSIHYRGPSAAVDLTWPTGEKTYHFTAGLPVEQVAFGPHELPLQTIEQLSAAYTSMAVVREQPNPALKAEPIINSQDRPFAFHVDEVRENWISLKDFDGARIGWFNADNINTRWPLRQYLPELDFVDGAVGYMLPSYSEYVRSLLSRFIEKADRDREAPALALATWIHAISSLPQNARPNITPQIAYVRLPGDGFRDVTPEFLTPDLRRRFDYIVELLPSSAQARNQKALLDLAVCCIIGNPAVSAQTVLDEFIDAVRVDPRDDHSLGNLESFYIALQYYKGPNASGIDRSSLARRAYEIRNIREFLKTGMREQPAQVAQSPNMTFFVTSAGLGNGADLGGLAGADAHCQAKATAAGAGNKTWRAYLSTNAAAPGGALNARDRIGKGPWKTFKGEVVAQNVDELHSDNNKINLSTALTEKGTIVAGFGFTPNQHDALTGSTPDGRAFPGNMNLTCNNWTSSTVGTAMVGHIDRRGAADTVFQRSWNAAHMSRGCRQPDLIATGGNGLFYCFAAE
jgi:hypothetical protein